MPPDEVFSYVLTIKGRLQASSRDEVLAAVRHGVSLSVEVHDSIEDLTLVTASDLEPLRRLT